MNMRDQKLRAMLYDDNTSATTLLVIAADKFGKEFLQWDPETISDEIRLTFGEPAPRPVFNKLMAAIQLVNSNEFYRDKDRFIDICNALGGWFSPGRFDPADAGEIAWGITEALLIWPPEQEEQEPFAPEIIQYIAHTVREEGIMIPPDVLRLGISGDEDVWGQVQQAYSDDPVMFKVIHDTEKSKTDEINQMVKQRLRLMLEQLETLQLEHGDAAKAVERMLQALRAQRQQSQKPQPAI